MWRRSPSPLLHRIGMRGRFRPRILRPGDGGKCQQGALIMGPKHGGQDAVAGIFGRKNMSFKKFAITIVFPRCTASCEAKRIST